MARSDEELQRGAEAVNYELGALVACYRRLLKAEDDGDAIGKNAYLEAMLVHGRCLIEFIAKPRQDRHIHRHDYLDGWELSDTADRDRAEQLFDEISKHLAHLSWERAEVASPTEWPYELPRLMLKLFRVQGEKPWAALFDEGGVQYVETQLEATPRRTGDGATTSGAFLLARSDSIARPR